MNHAMNTAVAAVDRLIGMPDNPAKMVTCVDCGKSSMAARHGWMVNMETLEHTGPHCGCVKREKSNGN